MVKYKNIRIKMKGGGTRTQRVRVLASGKYRFVKNIGSRVKKLTKRSRKNPIRRKRKLARRRGRRRGKRKFTLPLAPIIGIIAMPNVQYTVAEIMRGDLNAAMNHAKGIIGMQMDNQFHLDTLFTNMVPLLLGLAIHKFVGGAPLNVNRMLAAANVPVLRL